MIHADLPGHRSDVRLTRPELEGLIAAPLTNVVAALENLLSDNRIPMTNLAAVATVGGGATIPFVTQQLSEQLRVPVVTTRRRS